MAPSKKKLNSNKNKNHKLLPELAAEEAAMAQEERMSQLQMELEQQERLVRQLREFKDVREQLTSEVAQMMSTNEHSRGLIKTRQEEVEKEKEEKGFTTSPSKPIEEGNTDDQQQDEPVQENTYESDFDVDEEDDNDNDDETEAEPSTTNDEKNAALLEDVMKTMMKSFASLQQSLEDLEKEKLLEEEREQQQREEKENVVVNTADVDQMKEDDVSIVTEKEILRHVDPVVVYEDKDDVINQDEPQHEEQTSLLSSPPSSPSRLGFGISSVRVIEKRNVDLEPVIVEEAKMEQAIAVNEDLVEEDDDLVVVRDEEEN